MVHTCPRCELKFLTQAELEEHLRLDHHIDAVEFDGFKYRMFDRRPHTKRYLVVANQTLSEPPTLDRVVEATSDGHVHLVVPATPSAPGSDNIDDKGLGLASYRLRHAVDALRDRGVDAEGEVGSADPIRAVATALEHERADEVIVSTLPEGASKWLQVDLPRAIEHRFGLPVRVLTATA